MRRAISIYMLSGALTVAAANVVPGVSRELARERKECLDSVKYNFTFHYPNLDESKLYVEEEIAFHYSGGLQDCLQIDFDGEKVGTCIVNGRKIIPEWKANHILIPNDLLRVGQNNVKIECRASAKALNANPNYMYTLFVPSNAHSAFPCFDQPDLKANFTLTLHIPDDFQCMSTMGMESEGESGIPGTKRVTFKESPLLPTYLMSWVIGDFRKERVGDMTVLHNETDTLKTGQIPEMCALSSKALGWLEDYTGIPYPFEKYDFAIIPGFQFGGMEHPGAILYPPERTFLSDAPTPEEILGLYELISHETSHMWFGDLVTMRWFDDVWTKEVFANFMASKFSSNIFPDIDHNFNFIRGNYPAAYSTDRTDGTHPIAQDLDNLNNAGLVYGNIIYNKAPIMMRMLEKRIGEERLREGLGKYLRKYAFGNSSWDELIDLLDNIAPEADLKGFSEAWVKQKGMPTIATAFDKDSRTLTIEQEDPTGAGTVWPQSFSVKLVGTEGEKEIVVDLFEKTWSAQIDLADLGSVTAVVPNSHGEGYGYFKIDGPELYTANWERLENDGRYAAILNLANAWVGKEIACDQLQAALTGLLPDVDNPIIAAAAADVLATMAGQNEIGEDVLWNAYDRTAHRSVKQRLLRSIYAQSVTQPSTDRLYGIWEEESDTLMNSRDYMAMAYRLAILKPETSRHILETQRRRIAGNPNLAREFDFVSRACVADAAQLLDSLKLPENRHPEPWTAKLVALILDPARDPSTEQIKTVLDMMPDVKATGGIFFPTQWAKAVMSGIRSPEARRFVADYCASLDAASPLSRKLLEASYLVRRSAR